MKRSLTVFTALLCSVSVLPLSGAYAVAAPAPLADWHVAPVLSRGQNQSPYCAMATSYPQAGVIITHARNQHGSGTVAFDFQNASFEAKQYYGIAIGFNGQTQQFAAQAKNSHLLVIDLRNDHPLYSALDAGQDIDVSIEQGGPHVTLAGNSRAFFQLNYCVQALNDAPPAEITADAKHVKQPGFGLLQPATKVTPAKQTDKKPLIAQATSSQDGDETRTDLSKMLDQARSGSNEINTTKRQKLSGISSTDAAPEEISAKAVQSANTKARNNLLFDDPNKVNQYLATPSADKPTTSKTKSAPAVKTVDKPAAVKTAAPVVTPPAKPIASPSAETATKSVLPPTVVAAPAPKALPDALPLPDEAGRPVDSLSTPAQPPAPTKPPIKTGVISDTTRVVSAKDYLKDPNARAGLTSAAAEPAPVVKTPVAAVEPKPTPPTTIQWDNPPAPKTTTQAIKDMVAAQTPAATTSAPVAATPKAPAPISSPIDAAERKSLLQDNPNEPLVKPKTAAPTIASNTAIAPPPAPVVEKPINVPAAPTPQPVTPPPAMVAVTAAKPALAASHVIAAAATPVTPKGKAAAKILPAPAMPPALVDEKIIGTPVHGPMKRASEVVSVDFPDELPDDDQPVTVANAAAVKTASAQFAPLDTPAAVLQKGTLNPNAPVNFKPPAVSPAEAWQVKSVTGSPGYCVLQTRFTNQQSLFLSRAIDGNTTIGVDFGMDLLQTNRDYKTTVQVDNLFAEDFLAQARQPNLMVVQAGLKDGVFQALAKAKALHLEMEGMGVTFDVHDIRNTLSAFNNCLTSQGGTPIALIDTPSGPASFPVTATVASAPVAVVSTPAAPLPKGPIAPEMPAQTVAPSLSLNTSQVANILRLAHLPGTPQPDANGYRWDHGRMVERHFAAGKANLIEAVMRDIDAQETTCHSPSFTSQVGMPEEQDGIEMVKAETSCTQADNKPTVSALLYQRIGQLFRVWTQTGSQNVHDNLIAERDRLANVLQRDKTVAASTNTQSP